MLALLLAAALQPGELAPLDFLVGHCWRGEVKPGHVDTHCFTSTDAGVRDRHEVVAAGNTVYWGETDYRWDTETQRIAFVYRDASGEVGKGAVAWAASDTLDFGSAEYATGPFKVTIATRWVRIGADAYDAIDTSDAAPFNRTTRYVRVAD